MAAVSAISTCLSNPSQFLSRHNLSPRSTYSIRCCAGSPENNTRAPQLLKLAVRGATEFLRLLPHNKRREEDQRTEDVVVAQSVDDVVEILKLDYMNAYFLTGKFTSDLYVEDCLFEDPTIKFRGRDRYSQNLDLLVPFFVTPSLELEKIDKVQDSDVNFVIAKWKLRGTTTYDLDAEFKIVRHAESWNISALQAVGQIFALSSKEGD